jgi:hypothetical protein
MAFDPKNLHLMSNLVESPEYLRELGRITTEFSLLDTSLCYVFGLLIGDSAKGHAVYYSTRNHKTRCDMVRALGRVALEGERCDQLVSLLKAASSEAEHRNALIHDPWMVNVELGNISTSSYKPANARPEIRINRHSAESLEERADRIATLAQQLQRFGNMLFGLT